MLLVVLDRNGARLTLDDSWAWCVWWGQRTTDGRLETPGPNGAHIAGGLVRPPAGFAPIAIGLALTLIYLNCIPVTDTSVDPARGIGVAVFLGDWTTAPLWLFWLVPMAGALLGALD